MLSSSQEIRVYVPSGSTAPPPAIYTPSPAVNSLPMPAACTVVWLNVPSSSSGAAVGVKTTLPVVVISLSSEP